jgi:hypothetical protein
MTVKQQNEFENRFWDRTSITVCIILVVLATSFIHMVLMPTIGVRTSEQHRVESVDQAIERNLGR